MVCSLDICATRNCCICIENSFVNEFIKFGVQCNLSLFTKAWPSRVGARLRKFDTTAVSLAQFAAADARDFTATAGAPAWLAVCVAPTVPVARAAFPVTPLFPPPLLLILLLLLLLLLLSLLFPLLLLLLLLLFSPPPPRAAGAARPPTTDDRSTTLERENFMMRR